MKSLFGESLNESITSLFKDFPRIAKLIVFAFTVCFTSLLMVVLIVELVCYHFKKHVKESLMIKTYGHKGVLLKYLIVYSRFHKNATARASY